jgi:hypothetical protein
MTPSVPEHGRRERSRQLRELASFLAYLVTGKHD